MASRREFKVPESPLLYLSHLQQQQQHHSQRSQHQQEVLAGATEGPDLTGKKVVVVGAGPAGCCVAMALANLGASVTVCEQRGEDTFAGTASRSYVIILARRGLDALEAAGFKNLMTKESRLLGTVNINTRGKVRASKAEGNAIGFERRQLAQTLKDQVVARHPHSVRFRFGLKCHGGNLDAGHITFQSDDTSKDAELVKMRYDLLIGADGQNSRVRDLLEDQVSGFTVDRQSGVRAYQPFVDLPSNDSLEPKEWRQGIEGGRTLFLWSPSKKSGYNLSYNRRPDGSFAGNLTGPGTQALDDLQTQEAAEQLIREAFANVPEEHVPLIAHQAVTKDAVELPNTIKTSQLHGPKTLLIGDAAHCVTPILGQGANAALEDASILVDTLSRHGADLQHLPQAFNEKRLRDAQALVDLNRYFVWATGLGPATLLGFVPVLLSVGVGSVLSLIPGVGKPPLTSMDKGASYAKIVNSVKRDVVAVPAVIVAAIVLARMVVTKGA